MPTTFITPYRLVLATLESYALTDPVGGLDSAIVIGHGCWLLPAVIIVQLCTSCCRRRLAARASEDLNLYLSLC